MKGIPSVCAAIWMGGVALAAERPVPLKEARGREVTEAMCSGCHSLDYIRINAGFMNKQVWTAEVNKMIQAYGAPISASDAAIIADYLSANYGTEK